MRPNQGIISSSSNASVQVVFSFPLDSQVSLWDSPSIAHQCPYVLKDVVIKASLDTYFYCCRRKMQRSRKTSSSCRWLSRLSSFQAVSLSSSFPKCGIKSLVTRFSPSNSRYRNERAPKVVSPPDKSLKISNKTWRTEQLQSKWI